MFTRCKVAFFLWLCGVCYELKEWMFICVVLSGRMLFDELYEMA